MLSTGNQMSPHDPRGFTDTKCSDGERIMTRNTISFIATGLALGGSSISLADFPLERWYADVKAAARQ